MSADGRGVPVVPVRGPRAATPEETRTELRRRAEAATPGPWRQASVSDRNDKWTVEAMPSRVALFVGGRVRDENDAAFITAANPATVLWLLDELDRLTDIAGRTVPKGLLDAGQAEPKGDSSATPVTPEGGEL